MYKEERETGYVNREFGRRWGKVAFFTVWQNDRMKERDEDNKKREREDMSKENSTWCRKVMLNISHYDRMIESNERKREGERERDKDTKRIERANRKKDRERGKKER